MIDFKEKIAVVTGGSSGIGRRLALDMAREGATVVAIARRDDKLREVADELCRSAPQSTYRVCDLAQVGEFRNMLKEIESNFGRIDILINAAGVEERTVIEAEDLALYRRVLEINFFAPVAGTLAVVPGMLRRGAGFVVNVSSDSARAPGSKIPAYGASKAALSAFTESLAVEVAGSGVHLHVLYPGWVPTPMGMAAVKAGMPMPPRFVRRTEEQVSKLVLRRLGAPGIEINAVPMAAVAPMARAFFPWVYLKQMKAQG